VRYRGDAAEFHRIRREYVDYAFRLAKQGQPVTAPRDRPEADPLAVIYCEQLLSRAEKLLLPAKVGAQVPVAQPPAKPDTTKPKADTAKAKPDSAKPQPAPVQGMSAIPGMTKADSIALARANAITMNPDSVRQDSIRRIDSVRVDSMQKAMPKPQPVDTVAMLKGALAGSKVQLLASREGLDNLAVEIHKKFALSFACLVFVLFGPPIALRFPRGGVGVTIGVSIGVFGLYYVCLMGGESLADKGMLPAWFAMWIANIVFTVAGVLLLWGLESTTDTSRGGGLKDRFDDWRTSRRLRRAARAGARA